MIDEDDEPLLHNNVVPGILPVDNTALPQLLVTVMTGVGVDFVDVHPFAISVRVTL